MLPPAWVATRFAEPHAAARMNPDAGVAADVLRCGELATLLDAILDPPTVARFVRNTRLAFTLNGLRIPADPRSALAEVCR